MVTSQRKGYSIQCDAGTNHAALDGFNVNQTESTFQYYDNALSPYRNKLVQVPRIRKPKGKRLAY
ncbi:18110_t:CDS:2 [Dentiscutata erythropus]|uniref:18110_t:CDS:1 n=1 Tax=Dentiscutata erythropus TaxID=1348616 RepID=A0A9N9HKN5_9GLOM|nr:18110_t:CDS:2 [Dentiscutata erythropus]